jgi:C4-dicarboxylate-specific signal transduction histidine kinase
VSTEKTDEILKKSKLKSLADANKLLASYAENLSSFLQADSKGKLLIDYYSKIRDYLDREHMQLEEENKILLRKFNLIKNTIEMQQDHARADFYVESVDMEELLDEVMMVIEDFLLRNGITIRKKILSQKEVFSTSQRSKLFNIMLNLVKNAAESVLSNDLDNRFIDIAMNYCDDNVVINVSDNGSGITPEEMPHLFEYGFTTKEGGNGFGLHFCSNTLREMMGSLSVKSEGRGKGAEFTITIPRAGS